MTTYFDTSALAKLGIPEEASEDVRRLFQAEEVVVTSVVTFPELTSALLRALGRGGINLEVAERARDGFAGLWPDLAKVELSPSLVQEAEALVWTHRLRAFDAVHLASGKALGRRMNYVRFATFDRRLGLAARDEGLDVWPPDQEATTSATA